MAAHETLLIADDQEINRAILQSLFEGEFNLLEAENGEQAMLLLRQYRESISAVLLDLVMPGMDGYAVLEEMRKAKLLYHVPVVVITADDSSGSRVKVFELGASDAIAKPFEPEVVRSRIKNVIELGRYRRSLEDLVEEQAVRAREANAAVIDMLSSVIESRSLESGLHIRRIRMFTKVLLQEVSENYREYDLDSRKIERITSASSLHDIGKIAIPDRILNKPGRLTAEEFEIMKTHTTRGCELLSGLDRIQDREYLQYAYEICRYHHERWDGHGYPDGLKGNSIPLCAQVVAIADCYDALTTDRVYKKAIPSNRAFSMILNGECGAFSQLMLECFKNVREPFANLTEQYADGLPAELNRTAPDTPEAPVWDMGDNKVEQIQQKYSALLRFVDATVIELDCDTGIYHLVYQSDRDFSALRSGSGFESTIRNFVDAAVHPDDREQALGILGGYIQEFFDEGLTFRELRYRVMDRSSNTYVWCRVTVLRTDLDNPRLRRILLIWKKEEMNALVPASSADISNCLQSAVGSSPAFAADPIADQLLGGIHKFRCDRYFTMLQSSPSLMLLSGYSEREVEELYQNRLINMIHPSDREQVRKEFKEQRNTGKLIELDYRIEAKGGRSVWVSNRCIVKLEDGEEVAYGVLLDITRRRQAEEELRLSLERHSIIMGQTNDIIFEWDILQDELSLSDNWANQFGYSPIVKEVKTRIPAASHLHPDDMPAYLNLMNAMIAGIPYQEAEFRIADAKGTYRWVHVRATAQFDLDGKPTKAVGVILNIDAQKRASAELEERAAKDALTGLYNKAASQVRIEARLANCEDGTLSAMMVLDVDDFKQVNDQYGHMFGDAVLVELTAKLSGLFRGEDIISRIGGDEFLIFMPDIRSESVAEQRAKDIIRELQDPLLDGQEDAAISCSIGLAFATGRTLRFQSLFDYADRALYRAKAAGKNRIQSYADEMKHGFTGAASARRTEIESDQPIHGSLPDFTVMCFDLLYDTSDFSQAVQSILTRIGEIFEISRTYIVESDKGGKTYSTTFEWCAEGIEPRIHSLQRIPYVDSGVDYRENFDGDGLFYCQNSHRLKEHMRSMLKQQSVLSTLQFAILENGNFHGFVGFDDCRLRRLWTKEQADALTFLGKLLSVFLLKNRAQEALANTVTNLHSVLDHQEAWLYVLDPDTYTLRYVNARTKQLVPEAVPGRACYEVFYQRDRPCDRCVLRRSKEAGQCTMEIYNPYLGFWILADGAIVDWNQWKACLIACRDISAYKTRTEDFPKPSS